MKTILNDQQVKEIINSYEEIGEYHTGRKHYGQVGLLAQKHGISKAHLTNIGRGRRR